MKAKLEKIKAEAEEIAENHRTHSHGRYCANCTAGKISTLTQELIDGYRAALDQLEARQKEWQEELDSEELVERVASIIKSDNFQASAGGCSVKRELDSIAKQKA